MAPLVVLLSYGVDPRHPDAQVELQHARGKPLSTIITEEGPVEVAQRIRPSREARQLFNKMFARSDGKGHLPLNETLRLGVERIRSGEEDPLAREEIRELHDEEWIDPADDGGWLLH